MAARLRFIGAEQTIEAPLRVLRSVWDEKDSFTAQPWKAKKDDVVDRVILSPVHRDALQEAEPFNG